MKTKLDKMLETAVEKIAPSDPQYPLDLTVVPEQRKDIDALAKRIEQCGGKVMRVNDESLSGSVPAGQVRNLADSDLVSALRLVKQRRLH